MPEWLKDGNCRRTDVISNQPLEYSQRRSQDQMVSLVNSALCLKKELTQCFSNYSEAQKGRTPFLPHLMVCRQFQELPFGPLP